jgi:exonuclease VII small subunit
MGTPCPAPGARCLANHGVRLDIRKNDFENGKKRLGKVKKRLEKVKKRLGKAKKRLEKAKKRLENEKKRLDNDAVVAAY